MNRYFVCICGKKCFSSETNKNCPLCGKPMMERAIGMTYSDEEIKEMRMKHRLVVGISED